MNFIVVIDIDGFVVIGIVSADFVVVVVVWLAFYSFSSHNKFNRIGKVAWARSFDRIGWVNAVQDTLNKRDKTDKMGIGADVYGIHTWARRGGEWLLQLSKMYLHFAATWYTHRTVFIYCALIQRECSVCVSMNCKICNRILNSHTTSTIWTINFDI